MSHSLRPALTRRSLLEPPPVSEVALGSSAVLNKGFRPFFLLAALFAIAIVPLWLLVLNGNLQSTTYLPPAAWHAHEMIFGFVTAVVAGFLLTAVGNWTQRETATGSALLALALLWVAGRVTMSFAALLPRRVVALTDLAFWLALLVVLARPLITAGNRRNYVILAIVSALFAANTCIHLSACGIIAASTARSATFASVDLIVLLISIIAGRIFPMFTRNATGVTSIRSLPALDVLAILTIVALTVVDVVAPASVIVAPLAGVAGALAAIRALHWGAQHSFKQPLLWILHTGYAWLVIGLVLRALPALGIGSESLALHALTVGAIGALTLGMMARVSLGHTGRMLVASATTAVAFALINLAALVRVVVPWLAPQWYFGSLVGAGVLWVSAFALFLRVYTPILSSPRVDGRAG